MIHHYPVSKAVTGQKYATFVQKRGERMI